MSCTRVNKILDRLESNILQFVKYNMKAFSLEILSGFCKHFTPMTNGYYTIGTYSVVLSKTRALIAHRLYIYNCNFQLFRTHRYNVTAPIKVHT